MYTKYILYNATHALIEHEKVKELLIPLQAEKRDYLFRYGTIDEIIQFPHQGLSDSVKNKYDTFIEEVYQEVIRREQVWMIWELWRHQPLLRIRIDEWFIQKIFSAKIYDDFADYLIFISPQITHAVFERIFSVVTAELMANEWSPLQWLSFERIFTKPEKDDDSDVKERYARGQQLFKEAAHSMNSVRYAEFKARLVTPISLKLGGTDLSPLFRY